MLLRRVGEVRSFAVVRGRARHTPDGWGPDDNWTEHAGQRQARVPNSWIWIAIRDLLSSSKLLGFHPVRWCHRARR